MKTRTFLAPLPLLVGSLAASTTATAGMNEKSELLTQDSQTGDQSPLAIKLGQVNDYKVGDDVFGFILNKGENGIMVADHYSHRSHASHASHSSHYSSR